MATKKNEALAVEEELKETELEKMPEKEEEVWIMVPYIEGQDPEVTVIINGHVTKFRKGEQVKVKKNVAEVISNSNQQMMTALRNQEKFKNQRTDL